MSRVCLFCGGSPVTKEHVWPAWVRRKVNVTEPMRYEQSLRRADEEMTTHVFQLPVYDLQVRAVCRDCNSGWMARLEDGAREVLDGPLEGRGRAFHETSQRTLAAWALKTAMMLEQTHRDDLAIPREHYRYLAEHGEPPAVVWISMAAFTAASELPAVYQHFALALVGADGVEPDEPNAYGKTFTLGPLAFQVFGSTAPELRQARLTRTPHVYALWPYESSFTWMPQPAFDEDGLTEFSASLVAALGEHVRS